MRGDIPLQEPDFTGGDYPPLEEHIINVHFRNHYFIDYAMYF